MKLIHEDFKSEASLYNFANGRPAGLQQRNFALKMLKKERKKMCWRFGWVVDT